MGKSKPNGVSRRSFIASTSVGAGAVGATAGISGCVAPAGPSESGGLWERPPDQRGKGNRQNLIFLNTDTFRADNLQAYGGNGLVRCPRLDRFAEDCVVFEDCYPEGMPTIPIRRVLMTGRRILPYHYFHQHEPVQTPGWHELYYEDQTVAETLLEAGYQTAFFADIPHLQRPGKNFHRGYRYYEWSRGHEVDYYEQASPELSGIVPAHYPQDYWDRWVELDPGRPAFMRQFLANRRRYETECEAIIELTAKNVINWLRRNHANTPFFLHLEAFDPHEPWDPPKRFLDEYMPDATGPTWWEPPYADIEIPQSGIDRLRANYAGESMCVDYWIGEILATVEDLGLFDNSVVAFFSDHGSLLGEQGQFLKGPTRIRRQVTHNPFLVRLPGKEKAGTRASGFVHHPDVMPTLFSLLELNPPPRATGKNLWGLANGEESPHDGLVQGYGWVAAIRTKEWQFSKTMDRSKLGYDYAPELYSRADDADELTNVADQHPDVVADLSARIDAYLESGKDITTGHFHAREDSAPRKDPERLGV